MKLGTDAIIGRTVLRMIDAGYRVELMDQGSGQGCYLYAWENGTSKPDSSDGYALASNFKFWISFNVDAKSLAGVIHDYSTNLLMLLRPVIDYSETLARLFDDK